MPRASGVAEEAGELEAVAVVVGLGVEGAAEGGLGASPGGVAEGVAAEEAAGEEPGERAEAHGGCAELAEEEQRPPGWAGS